MAKEVNKQMVLDYIKYKETIDSCITEKNPEIIIDITIDNSTLLSMFRLEYPNVEFYAIEYPRNEGICSRIGSNTYYVDDEFFNFSKDKKVLSKFEEVMNTIKKQNPGKRIQILMNPPFDKGGDVWDICRKVTSNISCIMPLYQYKNNDRYKYIDKTIKIDEELFNGARIGDNNLLITSCSKNPKRDITYEDYIYEFSDDKFKEVYKWNRENFNGLEVVQTTNKSKEKFNRDTNFLTSMRGCSTDNYFATDNGMDYIYNLTTDEITLNYGLAMIKFPNRVSKQNFCTWSYNQERKKRLVNKLMHGLNLTGVGYLCNMAIPQINWETISDHPLWIEGDYDGAVLDTMGLKWNEDKTGVIKK